MPTPTRAGFLMRWRSTRICEFPAVYDFRQAQVVARTGNSERASCFVVVPGASAAAVVRRYRSPTGIAATLPAFNPGLITLDIGE